MLSAFFRRVATKPQSWRPATQERFSNSVASFTALGIVLHALMSDKSGEKPFNLDAKITSTPQPHR